MPNQDKQAAMDAFAAGKLQVLVSTTVIEVGINVPNATVMTIFGGQRFGLAQLHQLRGRVSRGSHAGHVCVFTDGDGSPDDHERLQIFAQTDDGFALAEADFRLRGPGDLLGRKQSGMPPLRIADLARDFEVLVAARQFAQQLIDQDPELAAEELADLRHQVLRRYGKTLDLGDVA
jgi:ATP-dependent DNA helicase RecG